MENKEVCVYIGFQTGNTPQILSDGVLSASNSMGPSCHRCALLSCKVIWVNLSCSKVRQLGDPGQGSAGGQVRGSHTVQPRALPPAGRQQQIV